MLLLKNKPLKQSAVDLLKHYQSLVDQKSDFQQQVAEGKRLFSLYNKKSNPAFKVVRSTLAEMSRATVRCNYCEDSHANQVEHIYPKNYYPGKCFSWENYCNACGPCNQPKSDHFAVLETNTNLEINLKDMPKGTPPPSGKAILIDPRTENPLEYVILDTLDTFKFVPIHESATEKRRAQYTIEILGLNSRSYLVRARKQAFYNFKARLYEYVNRKKGGASNQELKPLIDSLKSEHHQTVWHEMIRQRKLHPEIDDMLGQAHEALGW